MGNQDSYRPSLLSNCLITNCRCYGWKSHLSVAINRKPYVGALAQWSAAPRSPQLEPKPSTKALPVAPYILPNCHMRRYEHALLPKNQELHVLYTLHVFHTPFNALDTVGKQSTQSIQAAGTSLVPYSSHNSLERSSSTGLQNTTTGSQRSHDSLCNLIVGHGAVRVY